MRCSALLPAAVAGLAVVLGAAASTPAQPRKLLGSWERRNGKRRGLVRFEKQRVVLHARGRTSVYRAKYGRGKIELRASLKRIPVTFDLKGSALTLRFPRETWTLRKVKGVPQELDISPLPLGKARRVPGPVLKKIRAELARRRALDQEVRAPFGRGGRPTAAAQRRMKEVDTENTTYLIELLRKWGWIDARRCGADAAGAAFLIVQHSGNLRLMQAALPGIEKDVRWRKVDAQQFALLFDRLQVNLGERQRYGTQVGTDAHGDPVVFPLENARQVDKLRRDLGLMPLARYLRLLQQAYGGKLPRMPGGDPDG